MELTQSQWFWLYVSWSPSSGLKVQLQWCGGALHLSPAPGIRRLKFEGWAAYLYSPFPGWCLCVGHFGGFTKPKACVMEMYCCRKGRSESFWSNITWKLKEVDVCHCSMKWDKIPAPQANNNKTQADRAALLWSLLHRGCPALLKLLWGCSEMIAFPPYLGKLQRVGCGKGASKHRREEKIEKIWCWMYSSPSILGSVTVFFRC